MKKAVDVLALSVELLILAGASSFIVAIILKLFFYAPGARFIPTSFVKFSVTSLLLAIALSVRKTENKY